MVVTDIKQNGWQIHGFLYVSSIEWHINCIKYSGSQVSIKLKRDSGNSAMSKDEFKETLK